MKRSFLAAATLALATLCLASASPTLAQQSPDSETSSRNEIPESFTPGAPDLNYVRREAMIAMRDGVHLHTVILIPEGVRDAPMIFDRTPYNANSGTRRANSTHYQMLLRPGLSALMEAGYILVVQDVRGKHGSEGDYIMNRPIVGPLNNTGVDHATDTYDSIEWLVHNVPESNGRVATFGVSYDGFTATQGLINPHPALRAAVPISAMIDGWRGDDWFHNGAFRQTATLGYILGQESARGGGSDWPDSTYDEYDAWLRGGSAGAIARRMGLEQLGFWQNVSRHVAYDSWWQNQAVDRILAEQPLRVPTLWVASLWDQEDIYGTLAAYRAVEPKDTQNNLNYLVLGPWNHGGAYRDTGSSLGRVQFDSATSHWFQRHVLIPFLDAHLKTNSRPADIAPVTLFESGINEWRRLDAWQPAQSRRLYLQPNFALGFEAPRGGGTYDEYVSDPARPVPYIMRPVRGDAWRNWLATDQRPFSDRTDVLTYISEPLTEAVRVSGNPMVNLFASTSGTDSDWVVKLIDVYPDEYYVDPTMGGYQFAVSMNIFRGRYRESLSNPRPLAANRALEYNWAMPAVSHTFLPGHRIMVQIQSSWFPLYDRNPQTYVPNIMFAEPDDYRRATQRVYRSGHMATSIELPIAAE